MGLHVPISQLVVARPQGWCAVVHLCLSLLSSWARLLALLAERPDLGLVLILLVGNAGP
jgi:hypothetical protein